MSEGGGERERERKKERQRARTRERERERESYLVHAHARAHANERAHAHAHARTHTLSHFRYISSSVFFFLLLSIPTIRFFVGTIAVEAHTSLKQRRDWQRASSAGSCHLLAQILVHRPKSRQQYHLAPQTAFCRRVSWELCRRLTWASARRQKRKVHREIENVKRGLERRACAVFECFAFVD